MARTSLLAVLVLTSATSCLITDSPDEVPVTRTRPQLIETTPPTTEIIRLVETNGDVSPLPFSAAVLAEDAGQAIEPVLLTDYGRNGDDPNTAPYKFVDFGATLTAGTLAEGPRPIESIRWTPIDTTSPGCHTVTMLVTHEKKGTQPDLFCPKYGDDFDTLTWFVIICEAGDTDCNYSTECPIADDELFSYCTPLAPTSPEVMQ